MISRSLRGKYSILILTATFICSIVYFMLNRLQESYEDVQWTGERCVSELTSVKYQLSVVTEYKNHIDRLLLETQRAHKADKERLKDIMESCVAMKQQSSICQSQFEDLQRECKKVREDFDDTKQELSKLKTPKT